MTKFNPELPTLPFKVVTNGLEAADGYVLEALSRVPNGTEVECKFFQRRSNQRLKLYWAILGRCVENSEKKYGCAEDLHNAVKIALGYEHRIKRIGHGPAAQLLNSTRYCLNRLNILVLPKIPCISEWLVRIDTLLNELEDYVGDTIVLPGSISFSKMDEATFKTFFDKAMLELEIAGYPISEYLKESEQDYKRNKNYQSYPRQGVRPHGRVKTPRARDQGTEAEAGREDAA